MNAGYRLSILKLILCGYFDSTLLVTEYQMHCLECQKQLNIEDQQEARSKFELDLCEGHRMRMEHVVEHYKIPVEAVILYYHLKNSGIQSMLAWWDGKNQVDLAISRVKLNITIEDTSGDSQLTFPEFIHEISHLAVKQNHGFNSLRIPAFQIRNYPEETVDQLRHIIQEIRQHIKLV
ncbi:MAG: hypothetical protein RLZZ241_1844 [Bacteroidota bacterium]